MTPVFLTVEEVLEIQREEVLQFGGSEGVRDMGLLKSALAMHEAGMAGVYFHSDPHEMAAAYLFHIVKNHPFVDGNKRAGAATAGVFLLLNGFDLRASNERIADLVLGVAEGKIDKRAVAAFFRLHAVR